MGEIGRGAPRPQPNEGLPWVVEEHQKDLREEAQHEQEAKEAARARRRRWWPFGRGNDR